MREDTHVVHAVLVSVGFPAVVKQESDTELPVPEATTSLSPLVQQGFVLRNGFYWEEEVNAE